MASRGAIRIFTTAALAVSLLLSLGAGARARAQAAAAHVAEALFDEGRKLMAIQKYEEACTKFSASHRLDPAVGTLLNLGYCWKQIGKAASAWSAYREAASLAYWQHQREREAFARAEAAELERRLARLSIHVPQADQPGLELLRNGVAVPRDVWGVEVPVDPGEYTIEAFAPDRARFAAKVTVQAGAKAAVTVPVLQPLARAAARSAGPAAEDVAAQPAAPLRAPPPRIADAAAPAAGEGADEDSVLPALSIGVGSVGLIAFAVAGFSALRMQAQDDEARDICPDPEGHCTDNDVLRHEERKSAARDSRTVAYVSAGVGAACAIGAVALLLAAPDSGGDSARARGPSLSLGITPGELTLTASGAF